MTTQYKMSPVTKYQRPSGKCIDFVRNGQLTHSVQQLDVCLASEELGSIPSFKSFDQTLKIGLLCLTFIIKRIVWKSGMKVRLLCP